MGRNNKHKRGARNKRGPVRSERRPSLTGRVQLHEHSAYVITENGDYKVMGRGKREIMDGDTVAVSIKNSPHGERRAVIEGVVERAAISVVGTYQTAGPLGCRAPERQDAADVRLLSQGAKGQDAAQSLVVSRLEMF